MPLHELSEEEVRTHCKRAIESLEYWLRRLIDVTLSKAYGPDFINAQRTNGDNLINKGLRETLAARRESEPERYPRLIDAALLDHEIDIVCNPDLYKEHFKRALDRAFPDGPVEARTFLRRLIEPRNLLYHANTISVRQAEQVLCYSLGGTNYLVSYMEYTGSDIESDFDAMANDPTTRDEWWPITAACQNVIEGTPEGEHRKSTR